MRVAAAAAVAVVGWVALPTGAKASLIEGLVKIYEIESEKDHEKDLLLLKTIQTQLEATKWSGFADIEA